jgi:hypothetical protein
MYRLRQFARALFAYLTLHERILVVEALNDGELLLFERMARFTQRHSLDVYWTLRKMGYDDNALLKAALLHDCGKVDDAGKPIPLLYYGLFVVSQRFFPDWYDRAVANGRGVFHPFIVHAQHERRSVLMTSAMGAGEDVVAILRDYADGVRTAHTAALSYADNLN